MRETLELIRRNVKLEARLIDDLLDLGRIRTSKLKLQLESANAHDLLQYALEICRPEIERRGLKVEVELKATRPVLHADPTRLQQIFWNLLNNAVKFTQAGGTISLRSRDEGDGIQIEVSDTGLGLEPAHLTRIFDAFEQVESQDTKGLGLGLAICKALTELHGGRIVAKSAGPGQGATFIVTFTNAMERGASVTLRVETASGPMPDPSLKILVVEDHIDTARTLCRLLGHFGYDVQSAHSVAEALAVAKASPVDLLLTDMGLPDGSGDQLFLELKRSQPGLLGVAITGYGMDEDIARSSAAGFLNHFTKPIDFAFLRERLGEMWQN